MAAKKEHKPDEAPEQNPAGAADDTAAHEQPKKAAAEKPDKQGRPAAEAIEGNPGDRKGRIPPRADASHIRLEPYPTDWSNPSRVMLESVQGVGDHDLACKVHAAYQLTGVALSVLLPDSHGGEMVMGATTSAKHTAAARKGAGVEADAGAGCGPYGQETLPYVSDEEGCRCLEKLANAPDSKQGVRGLLDGPMAKILLAFAFKKLQEWLEGR